MLAVLGPHNHKIAVEIAQLPDAVRVTSRSSSRAPCATVRGCVTPSAGLPRIIYEAMRSGSPFGRLGTAEEVARVVVFLASPAANWITCANLIIDGGLTSRVDY
jgi:NAD(P)-dependent dehydrogenase (short-subunit alcohol dehydrogenase family)